MSHASPSRAAALLTILLFVAAPLALLVPAQAQPGPAPLGSLDWVAAWRAAHDRDGDRVEDDAEGAAAVAMAADRPLEPIGVLVTFDHAPDQADREALLARGADAGALYAFSAIPTINTRVPANKVGDLGSLSGVAAVEWDRPMFANLAVSAPATQARRVVGGGGAYDGFTAQDLGYTGAGMVVAVADTGVNELHAAFAGKFVTSADATAVAPPTCSPAMDEALHGTHVASTAVGNPAGNANKGTAMDARLVEIKVGSAVSIGGTNRAMQWAIDYNRAIAAGAPLCGVSPEDRIDAWTLSFGSAGRGGPNAGSAEALITTMAKEGIVVTIAAGNCGPSPSATCSFGDKENGISSPGNAAGALSIANNNDRNTVSRADDALSSSSSRGPNAAGTANANPGAAEGATGAGNVKDRHRKPDLSAPGTDIVAANGLTLDGYVSLSGTSMATPHVAGLAALLLQAGEQAKVQTGGKNLMRPTGTGYDASGTYAKGVHPVRDALVHAAEYKVSGVPADMLAKWEGPGADGLQWNNGHGYGHVNAFGAVCWAWQNVLRPGGATVPQAVQDLCFTVPPLDVSAGGPYKGNVGAPVALSAAATGGQLPYAFAWDLDNDAAYDDATGAVASVSFASPGTYPVAVRVTDGAGTVDTATSSVTVRLLPPEVLVATYDFDADTTSCSGKQGWFDAVGAATTVPPLVPGSPYHLTPVSPALGCSWYNGIDGVNTYVVSSARNLWGPCMTLPPGVGGGRFEFQIAGESEATFDFLYLRVNKGCITEQAPGVPVGAGTNVPLVVGRFDGRIGDIAASPPVYATRSVNLDAAVAGGGPFQLGFRFESDILFEEEGFWLDGFKLYLRDSAPSIVAPGSAAVDEGSLLSFAVSASDPEGDPVTLRAEDLPEGAAFDAPNGTFAWTPGHAAIGAHEVTFVASDGLLESRAVVPIEVRNLAPTAAGSADRDEADRINAVQFTDASTDPNGGRVVAWLWAFGDGDTSTAQHPAHTYRSLGTKTVTLTVTDEHGASHSAIVDTVKVKNIKPKAQYGGVPAEANRIEPVQFQQQSSDADGSIVSYLWAFGDGATSTAASPSHQYASLGDFTATLTVTDDDGDTAVMSQVVRVVNLLPGVDFKHSPTFPTALLPAFFDSTTSDLDGTVTSYAWTFGDGGTSSAADPVHVFLNGGAYPVALTVTDNDGGRSTRSMTVFVCAPGVSLTTLVDVLEHLRVEFEACVQLNGDLVAQAPGLLPVPTLPV